MSVSKFDMPLLNLESVATLDTKQSRSLSPTSSTTASDRNSDANRTASSGSDDGKSPSPDACMEDLYLISFTRCPREFRAGLLEGPILQDCRECMESAGLSTELETGTKIFCKPSTYDAARNAIQDIEGILRPYHVIVTEEFRPLVTQVVKAFPRALKVKCKEESVIARVGNADAWVPLSVESLSECKEAEPQTAEAKQRKTKNTKNKNSPKAKQRKTKNTKNKNS